ncbi:recombinase family protein [Phycicoccus sp. 3266]|uniref:recombinase family protein n=1 Tax=Phycicoccus sp. 3266 TaxID=2817751 RepID=UPI0028543ECB|nr:recombinase family protein [Phycicoccus sp. 3266]MDR6862172.1 DNA invertase Pin-like site-specific DNA recombinase [Phycicoccus sp. 3266]
MARKGGGSRRVIGMVRVSKVGSRGDELLSPDMQRTAVSDYCSMRGYEVTDWVEALDESASQARSRWWARLDEAVERVERGEADGIVVWKYSRAARHRRRWAIALDRVETAGGVLESATEQLDTTTSTGRLGRGMLAEVAAWEAEQKGDVWREVHRSRIARGLPASGQRRLGYAKSGGRYEPHPVEAPVVRLMYERYAYHGDRPAQLRELLRKSTGIERTEHGVQAMLDSGFAAGLLRMRTTGEERPGAHDPIISDQLWADYKRARHAGRQQSLTYRRGAQPLTGIIKCACGAGMTAGVAGSGARTFKCIRRKTYGAAACPEGAGAAEARVFAAVKAFLATVAEEVDSKAQALAQDNRRRDSVRHRRRRAEARVARLEAELDRLFAQHASREMTPALRRAFDRSAARLEAELLEAQKEASAIVVPGPLPGPEVPRTLLGSWDELVAGDPRGLRDVLAALIGRVEVSRDRDGGRLSRIVVTPRWEMPEPG